MTAVYEARVTGGTPAAGDGELAGFAWFDPADLPRLKLSRFARALLRATGQLP